VAGVPHAVVAQGEVGFTEGGLEECYFAEESALATGVLGAADDGLESVLAGGDELAAPVRHGLRGDTDVLGGSGQGGSFGEQVQDEACLFLCRYDGLWCHGSPLW
jgi:hypothetical protein